MEEAVKTSIGANSMTSLGVGGSGCISSGKAYDTDVGKIFVKSNSKSKARLMFEGEFAGLKAILGTNCIRVPKPLSVITWGQKECSALVMEYLDMKSLSAKHEKELGMNVANMHKWNEKLLKEKHKDDSRVKSEEDTEEFGGTTKFGFPVPTCCGYLEQDNSWQENWTVFFVRQRLAPQVDMILQASGDRELKDLWPVCAQKITKILDKVEDITPSLLHGDMWSGNVALMKDSSQPVIYDPAAFYGHSEYDFGIVKMFGGFSSSFFNAYHSVLPETPGFSQRVQIYELFHHLNHWNHFGSGYRSGTLSLMKKFS